MWGCSFSFLGLVPTSVHKILTWFKEFPCELPSSPGLGALGTNPNNILHTLRENEGNFVCVLQYCDCSYWFHYLWSNFYTFVVPWGFYYISLLQTSGSHYPQCQASILRKLSNELTESCNMKTVILSSNFLKSTVIYLVLPWEEHAHILPLDPYLPVQKTPGYHIITLWIWSRVLFISASTEPMYYSLSSSCTLLAEPGIQG